jgi:hypothetical protein
MALYFACLAFFLLGIGVGLAIWVSEIKIIKRHEFLDRLHHWVNSD